VVGYNTYEGWADNIQVYCADSIRVFARELEDLGLVESTDKYNKHKIDRTKWYTINAELLAVFMTLWEQHSSPIANGGRKPSEARQAFLKAWGDIEQIVPLGTTSLTNRDNLPDHYQRLLQ
jgi:hypothetical protein